MLPAKISSWQGTEILPQISLLCFITFSTASLYSFSFVWYEYKVGHTVDPERQISEIFLMAIIFTFINFARRLLRLSRRRNISSPFVRDIWLVLRVNTLPTRLGIYCYEREQFKYCCFAFKSFCKQKIQKQSNELIYKITLYVIWQWTQA